MLLNLKKNIILCKTIDKDICIPAIIKKKIYMDVNFILKKVENQD